MGFATNTYEMKFRIEQVRSVPPVVNAIFKGGKISVRGAISGLSDNRYYNDYRCNEKEKAPTIA
jgi:hypothetical protein